MYDSIKETYNDIKLLLNQNLFYIQTYEKTIALCIKKTFGIQYDIVFPLKEGSLDLKEIVSELCEKNSTLEEKINSLEKEMNKMSAKNRIQRKS